MRALSDNKVKTEDRESSFLAIDGTKNKDEKAEILCFSVDDPGSDLTERESNATPRGSAEKRSSD